MTDFVAPPRQVLRGVEALDARTLQACRASLGMPSYITAAKIVSGQDGLKGTGLKEQRYEHAELLRNLRAVSVGHTWQHLGTYWSAGSPITATAHYQRLL